MFGILKRLASRLPPRYQQELKRLHFSRQARRGQFVTDEREFKRLPEWVRPGDWVLDIGANVGHYTARLSSLVGSQGRVIAFEPVPESFELLSSNVADCGNVSLFNVAASSHARLVGMAMPRLDSGLVNYYQAQVTDHQSDRSVLAVPVDSLDLPHAVSLAKIDVEGHESDVLRGMTRLLERDHPILIVEGRSAEVQEFLMTRGYAFEDADDSPNRVFTRA